MGNGFVLGHSSSGSLVPAVEEAVKLAIGSKLMNQIDSIHPGEHLAEILDELGISQYRLAKAIGVPPAPHQRDRPRTPVDHGGYGAAYRAGPDLHFSLHDVRSTR